MVLEAPVTHKQTLVGARLSRLEGKEKVTGASVFAADMRVPGMLHAKVIRSPYAHALVRSIDASAALALPGVHAVVSAADLPAEGRDNSLRVQMPFAEGEALFHGQPVAAVAAETEELAERAAELVKIDYEPLPPVLDVEAALVAGSPEARLGYRTPGLRADLHANVNHRVHFQQGNVAEAFASASVVVEGTFDVPGVHQGYLEPQVVIADYDRSGRLTVWSPTQGQFQHRADVAKTLGLPMTKVRYIATEVGGGFGGKSPAVVQPICGLLALKTHRPVRLLLTRKEDLMATVPAPHGRIRVRVAADADGTFRAIEGRVLFEAGAFSSGPVVGHTMMLAATYRFPNLDVEGLEVRTNKVSGWAYRAPGGPTVTFAIEQLVDDIARAIGADPIELRLKNAVREGDHQPNGRPWPRIGMVECLESIRESEVWKNRNAYRGPNRGVGIAVGGWLGGVQPAGAVVKMNEDGSLSVVVGANDISGILTSFSQIAADVLDVGMNRIDIHTADTESAPFAGAATASKSTICSGLAVQKAAESARSQILAIAAQELGAPADQLTIANGVVRAPDGNEIAFARIAGLSTGMGGRYGPVIGIGEVAPPEQAPGFAAQVIALRVDPGTGEVTMDQVAAVQDAGRAINVLTVEGQLQGGATQGIGIGFSEELRYSADGKLLNPGFLDYRLPTSLDVPAIETAIVEVPAPYGPFGARMVGEPSIVPGAAAFANAVRDAVGVRIYDAPVSAERIIGALQAK